MCSAVVVGSRGHPLTSSRGHARIRSATFWRSRPARREMTLRRPTYANGHQMSANTSIASTSQTIAMALSCLRGPLVEDRFSAPPRTCSIAHGEGLSSSNPNRNVSVRSESNPSNELDRTGRQVRSTPRPSGDLT